MPVILFGSTAKVTREMRIPHIISKNIVNVYSPSPETLDFIGESERRILSENVTWNENHIPPLADFCVQTISKNFEKYPDIMRDMPCENRDYLTEILPTDLTLECAIVHIDDEHYWKRRYLDKFGNIMRRKRSDWTWKNCYLERHVQEILEQAQPQYNDEQFMGEILDLCAPYVEKLIVTQLQVWKPPLTMEKDEIPEIFPIIHINFQFILRKLPLIREIDLIIGMNKVGENFTWNMFEVSVIFFQNLGKALLDLKLLRSLKIHCSKVEYPHCQALVQNLIKNTTLVILDLSNCDLGDDGTLIVSKFLMTHAKLQRLSLANNNIRQKGAEGIGFALLNMSPNVFESLDMRLNPLGREGTMGILRALVRCSLPKELSLSGCQFADDIPERMGQVLKMNDSLTKLDISNNWFGKDGGDIIVKALEENTTLVVLDVRGTGITLDQQEEIVKYLQRNICGDK